MAATSVGRADNRVVKDEAGTPRTWVLLVALLGGATAWALQFATSYVLVAYACAADWRGVRPAIVGVSVVALVATLASGWTALRRWQVMRATDRPADAAWDDRLDERTAHISFLLVVGLTSAMLFGLGIVYNAFALWTVPLCEPGGTTR